MSHNLRLTREGLDIPLYQTPTLWTDAALRAAVTPYDVLRIYEAFVIAEASEVAGTEHITMVRTAVDAGAKWGST